MQERKEWVMQVRAKRLQPFTMPKVSPKSIIPPRKSPPQIFFSCHPGFLIEAVFFRSVSME